MIRGDDIVWNPLYGKIKMLLYNISTYHYTWSSFARRSCNKWLDELAPELNRMQYPTVLKVLTYFIEDMEHGPAMV